MQQQRSPVDRREDEDFEEDFEITDGKNVPLQDDEDFAALTAELEAQPARRADDIDELEADLAQAKANRDEATAVKQARERSKSRYGNTPEDLERIKRWELSREWEAVANVGLFRRYECNCKAHFTVFEGMMLEQKHRSMRTSNRWTRVEAAQANLPNKTAIRKTAVASCQRCTAAKGWDLATDLIWGM